MVNNQPPSKDKLMAYVDGELNDVERREIDKLLGANPELLREVQSLAKASNSLREVFGSNPPSERDGLSGEQLKRIRAKAAAKPQRPSMWSSPWLSLGGALAVASLSGLVIVSLIKKADRVSTRMEIGRELPERPKPPAAPEPPPAGQAFAPPAPPPPPSFSASERKERLAEKGAMADSAPAPPAPPPDSAEAAADEDIESEIHIAESGDVPRDSEGRINDLARSGGPQEENMEFSDVAEPVPRRAIVAGRSKKATANSVASAPGAASAQTMASPRLVEGSVKVSGRLKLIGVREFLAVSFDGSPGCLPSEGLALKDGMIDVSMEISGSGRVDEFEFAPKQARYDEAAKCIKTILNRRPDLFISPDPGKARLQFRLKVP